MTLAGAVLGVLWPIALSLVLAPLGVALESWYPAHTEQRRVSFEVDVEVTCESFATFPENDVIMDDKLGTPVFVQRLGARYTW